MAFITNLEAEFLEDKTQIRINIPFVYYNERYKVLVVVPTGFECDVASIPRIFYSLVGHPLQPKVVEAAVIHDYLYRFRDDLKRSVCDKIFYDAMREMKVPYCKAQLFWGAVRIGGGFTRNITKTLEQP